MKRTKRITTLALALLLLVGLTACGKDPASTEVAGMPAGDWTWADRYEGTFSDQGYYYVRDYHYLSYLDTSSGATTVLCTKTGCLHDQESCEAYLTSLFFRQGGSCFWDGKLYYLDESGYGFELYRSNATGMEREVIGTLGEKCVEQQLAVTPYKYAQVGNYWYYYATADGSVLNEETGVWTNKMMVNYISRIDLRTGKEEILIEDRENTLDLCAVQENGVLYTSRGIPEAEIRDTDYREQLKKLPVTLYCWNAESKQTSTLFEKDGSNFGKITVVVGEKLYYVLSEQKEDGGYIANYYVYDLATGKDSLFAENNAILYYGGEYVKRMKVGTGNWYLYGLESGKQMPIQVSSGYPRMECWTDRGCVVFWQVELEETGEKESRLCYVTYEALADGLQEADLMIFNTQKYGYQ